TPAGGGLLRAHRGGGVRAPVGGGELVAQHQPPAPHVTDDRVVGGDLAQSFFEPRALLGGVVHQAFFLHHLQRGDRGGGRDRVAPVGAALRPRPGLAHQLVAGRDRGKGETAGQSFGGDQHIRGDGGVLVAPERAGAPHTGLHFVEIGRASCRERV